jgi:type IV pilus assembly protein PilO
MFRKGKSSAIDWMSIQNNLSRQFVGLDPNDPSRWPPLPRALLLVALFVLIVGGLWYAWLSDRSMELQAAQQREGELREQYSQKAARVAALDMLKLQLEQVRQYVAQLEKQLPSKAEMDALLSDINQAGVGRGLQFELFRPGQEILRDYYAELPITIKVTGSYNEIAMFASDVAHLFRIVTLGNISINPPQGRNDTLVMETTARTFRYLDPEEVAAQKAGAGPTQGGNR